MARYNIYPGTFICHTCKAEVRTLRMYAETKEMTWMCADRHVSKVSLETKKNREFYERTK